VLVKNFQQYNVLSANRKFSLKAGVEKWGDAVQKHPVGFMDGTQIDRKSAPAGKYVRDLYL
jgi:hypothetical protein